MATYTETQTEYLSAKNALDRIKAALDGTYNLGSGYQLVVTSELNNKKLEVNMSFNGRDKIKEIPEGVILKYAKAIQLVNEWKADNLADFPDLKKL